MQDWQRQKWKVSVPWLEILQNELVGKLGMKNLSRGVKVDVLEDVVCVDLALNIEYGYNILETSKKVQERVKTAIEKHDRTDCFRCQRADCKR